VTTDTASSWRPLAAPAIRHPGWTVAFGLVLLSVAFVAITGMRPEFDAYGWLVWGRQTLHWNLDTNGAPSWKPLTYMFTLPYALAGREQPWLWMVTSVAVSLSGAFFAGRIAYRLTGPAPGRIYAPIIAAVFAGLGVLAIDDYWQLLLIANSDPMVVSLCLGAIDSHLSGRPRIAFALLFLASLGRPEAWVFTFFYAVWMWRGVPDMRVQSVIGLCLIPLLWFVIPALTSKSWFRAGDLALNSHNIIHGDKFTGVFGRFFDLFTIPMKVAAGCAVVMAFVRRDRVWLALVGLSLAWVLIEIGFALYGWSAVPRYLIEPAAVMMALAGATVGRVLAGEPRTVAALRWAGPVAVAALAVALVPTARGRARGVHAEIINRRHAGVQIDRLHSVIERDGGAGRFRACGQPVTVLGFQSTLAWELGVNVGNVGFKPSRSIHKGLPIVLFKPNHLGWIVIPIHTKPALRVQCSRLKTATDAN
jgi:hypothetical protein